MAVCKKIPRKIERVCVGSLNQRIEIFIRAIEPNAEGGFDLNLSDPIKVWAMIETVRGVTVFDETEVERAITHIFYIRRPYPFVVDETKWITFKGWQKTTPSLYDIRQVEDLNEERRFLAIKCNLRGNATFNRNKS